MLQVDVLDLEMDLDDEQDDGIEYKKLIGIQSSMGSGLAQLIFDDGSVYHISSGFGLRQLYQLAEGVGYGPVGLLLGFKVDDLGVIEGIWMGEGE